MINNVRKQWAWTKTYFLLRRASTLCCCSLYKASNMSDSCCVSMVNNTFMSSTVNVLKATQSYASRSVSKKQKAPVSVLHVSLCPSIGSILGWQFIKSHLTEFWSDVEAELEDKEGMETGRDRNASAGCLSPCRALDHSRSSFPSIVLRTTAHSHTLHRSQAGS